MARVTTTPPAARLGALVVALVLAGAAPTWAQATPTVQVSGGYSGLVGFEAVPRGLYGSAAWYPRPWLGVVGQATWHGKRQTFLDAVDRTSAIATLMGGVRFVPESTERVMVYAEILGGRYGDRNAVRETETAMPPDVLPDIDIELEASGVVLAVGGGVVGWLRPRIGVEALVQYRTTLTRSIGDYRVSDRRELIFGVGVTAAF